MAARLVEVARLTTHALAQHFRRYTHGSATGGGQAVVYTRWLATNSSGGARVKVRSSHVGGGQGKAGDKGEKKPSKNSVRKNKSNTSIAPARPLLTNTLTTSKKLINKSSTTITPAQPRQCNPVYLEPLKPKLGEGETTDMTVGLNAISSRGVERRTILGFDARSVRSPKGALHSSWSLIGFPFPVTPVVSRQLQHRRNIHGKLYGPSRSKKSVKKGKRQSKNLPDSNKYPTAGGDRRSSFQKKMKKTSTFFPMSDLMNQSASTAGKIDNIKVKDNRAVDEHTMEKYDKSDMGSNSKKTSWAFVLKDCEPEILGPETITVTSAPSVTPKVARGQVTPKAYEDGTMRGDGHAAEFDSVGTLLQKTIGRYPSWAGDLMSMWRQAAPAPHIPGGASARAAVSELKPEVVNKPKHAPELNIREHVAMRSSNEPKLTVSKNEIIARKTTDPSKKKAPVNSASPQTPAKEPLERQPFFDIYQGSNIFENSRAKIRAAIEKDNISETSNANMQHPNSTTVHDNRDTKQLRDNQNSNQLQDDRNSKQDIIDRWSHRMIEDQANRRARVVNREQEKQARVDREIEWKRSEREKTAALREKHGDRLGRLSSFPPVKDWKQSKTQVRNLNEAEVHEALQFSSQGLNQRDQELIKEIRNQWTTKFKTCGLESAKTAAPTSKSRSPQKSASFSKSSTPNKEQKRKPTNDPKSISQSQSSGRLYDVLDVQSGAKPSSSKRSISGGRLGFNTQQDSEVYSKWESDFSVRDQFRSDAPSTNPNPKPNSEPKPKPYSKSSTTTASSSLDDDILSSNNATHVNFDDGKIMRNQQDLKTYKARKDPWDINDTFAARMEPPPANTKAMREKNNATTTKQGAQVPGSSDPTYGFDVAKTFLSGVYNTYNGLYVPIDNTRQMPSNGRTPSDGQMPSNGQTARNREINESDTTPYSYMVPKACKLEKCETSKSCSKSPSTKSGDCLDVKYDKYLNEYVEVKVKKVVDAVKKRKTYPRYLEVDQGPFPLHTDQGPFPLHTPRTGDIISDIQSMLRDGPALQTTARQQRQHKLVDAYKKQITKYQDKLRMLEAKQRPKDKHLEF